MVMFRGMLSDFFSDLPGNPGFGNRDPAPSLGLPPRGGGGGSPNDGPFNDGPRPGGTGGGGGEVDFTNHDRISEQFGFPTRSGQATTAAGVTRNQWQHFLDFYRPIEDQVLKDAMQTDFTAEGDEAGRTAQAGITASVGMLERGLRRSGTNLSGEEREALGRRRDISGARAVGRAENTTRRGLKENRSNLLANIVGIGRGIQQSSQQGLQSVADMAAQREQSHQAGRTAAHATNTQAGATVAAYLAYYFM